MYGSTTTLLCQPLDGPLEKHKSSPMSSPAGQWRPVASSVSNPLVAPPNPQTSVQGVDTARDHPPPQTRRCEGLSEHQHIVAHTPSKREVGERHRGDSAQYKFKLILPCYTIVICDGLSFSESSSFLPSRKRHAQKQPLLSTQSQLKSKVTLGLQKPPQKLDPPNPPKQLLKDTSPRP